LFNQRLWRRRSNGRIAAIKDCPGAHGQPAL
jgi:hypothetical protein